MSDADKAVERIGEARERLTQAGTKAKEGVRAVFSGVDTLKARAADLSVDKVQAEIDSRYRSVRTELRANATWRACFDEAVYWGALGVAAGVALMVPFGRSSAARGFWVGIGSGAGLGVAYGKCNARFLKLQKAEGTEAPAPSASAALESALGGDRA